MCVYCMIADWQFQHNPPWRPTDPITPWPPAVPLPAPLTPIRPWSIEQLKEFQDLLKRVKALEDELGCPCEPNKADYIKLLKRRIAHLENQERNRAMAVKSRKRR